MASSTADSSTNDVTSTDNHSISSVPSMRITTEGIMRECVRLGLYRNPVCNDKLYLHGKGFDSVAPTAFDPYTDVKVLWLEGNALSTLACGTHYVQTQPPKRKDPFASASDAETDSEETDERDDEHQSEKGEKARVDTADATPPDAARHVDPMSDAGPLRSAQNVTGTGRKRKAGLPDAASVKPEEKDIFSSLYPTVRHVYLHNNVFRVMPDLHRFQRLNTVNLANNFFASVEPGCPEWNAARGAFIAQRDERRHLAESISKSAARERSQRTGQEQTDGAAEQADAHTPAAIAAADDHTDTETDVSVVDAAAAAEKRRQQLDAFRRYADAAVNFCPHNSIAFEEGGGNPKVIEDHLLRTCSSVRTLNLSGNQIEEFDDYVGLLCYKALSSVDLSQNQIKDGELLLLVLERLPGLLSLKLSGNPCVRTLTRYRKRVLAACPSLLTLDDRPVFEEERRLVTAWAEGGEPAEAKERQKMKEEKEAAQQKRLDDFRALLAQHRGESGSAGDAYLNAVSTSHALCRVSDGSGGLTAPVRGHDGADRDDTDSVTSSETESVSSSATSADHADVIVPTVVENTMSGADGEATQRVLSSNGAVTVDEDAEDIYVP